MRGVERGKRNMNGEEKIRERGRKLKIMEEKKSSLLF